MPTGSELPAAERARREAAAWVDLADDFVVDALPGVWADLPPVETHVIAGADIVPDLERRASAWSFTFATFDLAGLARFAAGLARAEANAWNEDAGPVATRAHADRRFFVADRLVPWVVPWLDAVADAYADSRSVAQRWRGWLLELGDELRLSPAHEGTEGLTLPGYDGYGPVEHQTIDGRIGSLWGGRVVLRATAESITGSHYPDRASALQHAVATSRPALADLYETAAERWQALGAAHPGTAGYWRDLADRARTTSTMLSP